ncbi:MAG: hypothetical protein GF375_06540 [Candidatus Omnitrophica bacterium]|nr:hypothetical protein [Candidatus Omnitrophota bacterium]MBD3269632.1 hypothetical protein [Candidatus Omnitrophota bacterium]
MEKYPSVRSLKFASSITVAFILSVLPGCLRQEFKKAKFAPPPGKIIFIVGQDNDTIEEYINNTGTVPAGFMVYTSIQECKGIYLPVDYGSGPQCFQCLVEKYPNTVIQLGLYMTGALEEILSHKYDKNIDKLSRWIKNSERPVYLRIGYEFDLPQNSYKPEKYIEAYRYIVDRLRKDKVENVAYVWHSCGCYSYRPPIEWYPGNNYVDWVGLSYFYPVTKYTERVVELAEKLNKPLMIGEATPRGVGTRYADYAWKRWFEPFFEFIKNNKVKAVCYINSDWESMPMWKEQGWLDARVQANPKIKNRWLKEIKKPPYLTASPYLYKTIGYKKKRD